MRCPTCNTERIIRTPLLPPSDESLPFFAYGVFKPGELAFLQIKEFVKEVSYASIGGVLLIRDGLPIASLDDPSSIGIRGFQISFHEGASAHAYRRIVELEPEKQYTWKTAAWKHQRLNVLVGKSPDKGSVELDHDWNGKEDPLFTAALDVIRETLDRNKKENGEGKLKQSNYGEWDLKPLFRLEMAYLLLWTSIERYASLRYHLRDKATGKVKKIATEEAFSRALLKHVTKRRTVVSAEDPAKKCELIPENPKKAMDYYYQVRSNIVHRGKGVQQDYERVLHSLTELFQVFEETRQAAFEESACLGV